MAAILTQLGLASFGLIALWLAMGESSRGKRWAPVIGLCAQPFWLIFAMEARAWGMLVLAAAYTLVYLRGAWRQWRPA